MSRQKAKWPLVAGVAVLVAATPALGEWLVTTDGTVIETEGPWEQRGSRVVFKTLDGTLSSLRVRDLDLEASTNYEENLKRRQANAKASQAPVRQPASVVITDQDVRRGAPSTGSAASEPGDQTAPEAASVSPLTVTNWSDQPAPGGTGLEIQGEVLNPTTSYATGIRVDIVLVDTDGTTIERKTAGVRRSTLVPGQSTSFGAAFPDVDSFADVRFEIQSFEILAADDDEEAEDLGEPASDSEDDEGTLPSDEEFATQDG